MKYEPKDHTFSLCAYGNSPYLESCIDSLLSQTITTNILIATSTPSDMIDHLAQKYQIPIYVNSEKKGIGADWNFAYKCAATPLVTITHQDDYYEPDYSKQMLKDLNQAVNPIIWFSDYYELRNGVKTNRLKNLKIKRIMLFPLRWKKLQGSQFVRRRILSFGSPICCPSVTYVKERSGSEDIFSTEMKVSLDWDQWEKQSRKRGSFVYCNQPMISHRIHEKSTTSSLIASNVRGYEDLNMFKRFWPEWMAEVLERGYSESEISNNL